VTETKPPVIPRNVLFSDASSIPVTEIRQKWLDAILPAVNYSVKKAENDKNFGVRSISVGSPSESDRILNNSIRNSFLRWDNAGRPGKFVDFMQQRWAPLGASNDPSNLNANWSDNVRYYLLKVLGPEKYARWMALQLASAPQTLASNAIV
jgi:hypothetical protein